MEYEFISCDQQLPPTECPLVIELPVGTPMYIGCITVRADVVLQLRAHRVSHIESKERDMRFELDNGGYTVCRPGWTYP